MDFSKSSFIHPEAKIGKNANIGPFCFIDKGVTIGDDCKLEPNVTIYSGTTIGDKAHIFPGAVIGAVPQDLKFAGEESFVEIGDRVIIRECVTINRATKHSITTRVGNDNLLMAYVHIAHDCQLGSNLIVSNAVNLAGHVTIDDYAILGGMVAVHQFVKIGAHSMVGGGSLVRKDVPPYVLASREPVSYLGINTVGLKRRGFSNEQIEELKEIYQAVFVKENNLQEAIDLITKEYDKSVERETVLDFIRLSERGLIRGPKLS